MFASNSSQVSSAATYIEDVFSTYLYTGNATARSITNGIDLAGKGGMVWFKDRSQAYGNRVFDTNRGTNKLITTNTTAAEFSSYTNMLTAFNADGFSIGDDSNAIGLNVNSDLMVSWTFRKQPKFFDVVTWTGDGTSNRQISHSLGSTPGCVIVKNTSSASDWPVYHRSLGFSTGGAPYNGLRLNGTNATGTYDPPISAASSTTITVTTSGSNTNQSGQTFVAYLFAHDAGGFGTAGTDNVISCGSFVSTGANQRVDINLGYQPQWVLVKRSDSSGNWNLLDSMRGFPAVNSESSNDPTSKVLWPNLSSAESDFSIALRTNGFSMPGGQFGSAGETYIYIAIRRGPMKTPTSGTSVFSPATRTGTGATANLTGVGFPPDIALIAQRVDGGPYKTFWDKLRGPSNALFTTGTDSEASYTNDLTSFNQDGISLGNNSGTGYTNFSGWTYVNYYFRRAPSFMDEVCYTGTGSATTVTHNLTVPPELIIVKRRNQAGWNGAVYAAGSPGTLLLDQTSGAYTSGYYAGCFTSTSATTFGVNTIGEVNGSGGTYVAWMWASCPGVSKVGSYTGNGTSQTINCGFTSGARFVMIKRTDSTGDWYVWDTARGIVSANDPHLGLNTASAEVTTNDSIDPDNTGFIVNQVSATNINVSSATYIYLAIA